MAEKFFDIDFDVERLYWKLDEAKLKQIPFALAHALSLTAWQAKEALGKEIKDVFDRPVNRTIQSPRYTRTSKKGPFFVFVFLSEDKDKGIAPSKILRAHVTGGQRRQKRHEVSLGKGGFFNDTDYAYTRPANRSGGARLNQYGNLPGPKYQSILSRLGLHDTDGSEQNETARSKARNRNKDRAQYFVAEGDRFKAVWERYGSNQGKRTAKASSIKTRKEINVKRTILPRKRRPVLVFIKKAQYEDRFDIKYVVELTSRKNMRNNFGFALARALRTAK